ncbi:MAG: transcriptional regulator [Candidatus Dactylopiibacterium carminicum]|uniref:Transcriptional regulator n=1 Tax=Candidatus Dactylopiibacterium carminicum TaxID=857335 RepID=A0A272ES76_9RHOO|nr:helix-turn-helix transcriptional regulator [Candidatus Dactylopiibacterium carminicum]KAF7600670.1 XRE family transcriptional regulator [Candidatus Dactylopiibacterium carminicum]PAS92973.1 MAG: transcriptional regulator [Candidatus Dactylopiibacterium carminicum]PAS96520.1 MAG: transcriptional regulator [Candidatus Dactylopiibacterium carminicum]PAT00672.1 MAG: hypothetical protein BSR46_00715 [Candidatus Dactylopiibacterium carminicum]
MSYKITGLDQLEQLASILKGFRKGQRLTQKAMAERLGMTQQAYAQLEADPSVVSLARLLRVLRAMEAELVLVAPSGVSMEQPAQRPLPSAAHAPVLNRRPMPEACAAA